MSMTDPIADMLTRMRNALDRQQPTVAMPHSKLKVSIAEVLKNEGYIESYEIVTREKFPTLVIRLRYVGGRRDRRSVINGLERGAGASRPSRIAATAGRAWRDDKPMTRRRWPP